MQRLIVRDWLRHLAERDRTWKQATAEDLVAWLARKPRPRTRARGRRLSASSLDSYSTVVRNLYAWAARTKRIRRDPMLNAPRPRGGQPVPRALPLETVDRLLEHARETDERIHVALWLAFGAGLRCAEIAGLRVEHVQAHGPHPALQVQGKGSRWRTVPLAPPVAAVLRGWLTGQAGAGPVFESSRRPAGLHLTPQSVSRLLADAMRAAGVDESAHSLRHTYATELLRASKGTALRDVSRLLGHANTAITERVYVSSYAGELEATANLLPDPRRA